MDTFSQSLKQHGIATSTPLAEIRYCNDSVKLDQEHVSLLLKPVAHIDSQRFRLCAARFASGAAESVMTRETATRTHTKRHARHNDCHAK